MQQQQRSMLKQRLVIQLLFAILPVVLSETTLDVNYDEDLLAEKAKKYDIKGSIKLECTVSGDGVEGLHVQWMKGDEDVRKVGGERYSEQNVPKQNKFGFKLSHAQDNDAGNYTCVASKKSNGEEVARKEIALVSKVHIKTPSNANVVEGEAIKIVCQVVGKPVPEITWRFGNNTYDKSEDRFKLEKDENGIENAILIIEGAQMEDRGTYTCIAHSVTGDNIEANTMIRIKDKYAALWPFLGICAEVFVLCAIILIYEKKRNKTELDESDTDQSPDQKATPDHGKDSNLRHRQ